MSVDESTVVRLAAQKDLKRIREIISHPEVAPTFFANHEIAEYLTTMDGLKKSLKRLQWYLWDGGVFLCAPMGAWCDMHIAVLPEFRGKKAFEACRYVGHRLFTRTPCEYIIGRTPLMNTGALHNAAMLGFKPIMVHCHSSIGVVGFLNWVAAQPDPDSVLRECEEHGFSFKTAAVRQILMYATEGLVGSKEE